MATTSVVGNEATMRSVWKAPSISPPWREPIAGAKYGRKIFFSSDYRRNISMACSQNAALFHVPRQELSRVLLELHATLKPGGVLFSSNPRGVNQEGWNSGRCCVFHDLEAWRTYASAAGFVELTHYYRPDGAPREQQPCLACVWRRLAPARSHTSSRNPSRSIGQPLKKPTTYKSRLADSGIPTEDRP